MYSPLVHTTQLKERKRSALRATSPRYFQAGVAEWCVGNRAWIESGFGLSKVEINSCQRTLRLARTPPESNLKRRVFSWGSPSGRLRTHCVQPSLRYFQAGVAEWCVGNRAWIMSGFGFSKVEINSCQRTLRLARTPPGSNSERRVLSWVHCVQPSLRIIGYKASHSQKAYSKSALWAGWQDLKSRNKRATIFCQNTLRLALCFYMMGITPAYEF
jgi:hypothetical protein